MNTYAQQNLGHPLRKFEQYELVKKHRSNEPNTGARNLHKRLEIPEGRIDGWLKGSKPTGYDSFETVQEIGWFDLEWTGTQFRALNNLIAWIYSSGSIDENFRTHFVTDDEKMLASCTELVEQANVGNFSINETGRDRATRELRITDPGAATGRFLVGLGAPRGRKSDQKFGLPKYLSIAPADVRRDFARRYIKNRGSIRPNYSKKTLTIQEERPEFYLHSLVGLFRSLTSGEVEYDGGTAIRITSDAVEEIL